ncbi:MAG: response regulator [Candidatus Cloacimonetes bacterium]|nr:response regulator [Candidatus Cloacimonadota bacterium]MCF7814374.1 response regulator [Candidatus Cloacimonadota bacterium]MCF7868997.1 response regulator [Candidatus Cloacimonadota bacterium]MCF7884391.1 response regulator [Candidatus Cloacimonadota bacterium]
MKILIVDDKQDARYLLKLLLEGRKYEVISAIHGREALDLLEKNKVDMIISDILMPEMDGFKFCQILKRDKKRKNIPFVFYTATYVDKKDEKFALGLGADLFLRKPMEPELLLKEIDDLCQKIATGKYSPSELTLKREADIYKLYNERLIQKLEHKIDRLEEEIEKREKVEVELKKMVAEKEVLLRELYHRTLNNMQVISSMLKLYSARVLDEKWLKIVKDINSKIKSTALVHRKLYESNDLSHLSLKDYFIDLINYIRNKFCPKNKEITISYEITDIAVLLDTAIPLGFVLNELLINAIEHAFPNREKGTIHIKVEQSDKNFILFSVQDDGIGLPEDFDMNSDDNLGLVIVDSIISNQMNGEIKYLVDGGTSWQIKIKDESYCERV